MASGVELRHTGEVHACPAGAGADDVVADVLVVLVVLDAEVVVEVVLDEVLVGLAVVDVVVGLLVLDVVVGLLVVVDVVVALVVVGLVVVVRVDVAGAEVCWFRQICGVGAPGDRTARCWHQRVTHVPFAAARVTCAGRVAADPTVTDSTVPRTARTATAPIESERGILRVLAEVLIRLTR
jgi:hypothetical protein